MKIYDYDRRTRLAGGIDVQDGDLTDLLSSINPESLSDQDVAYSTYLFEYIGGVTNNRKAKDYAGKLATVYARRFAGWLGYVFLNRANMTRTSKQMRDLQDAISDWTEDLPSMIRGPEKTLSSFVPKEAARFLKMDLLNKIGARVLKEVRKDYSGAFRSASNLESLPIIYNRQTGQYEIPGNQITYKNRNILRQLGFDWTGRNWVTPQLDQRALKVLPQAAKLRLVRSPAATPTKDPSDWFFEDWLPSNINRFSKLFTNYGRQESVPYEFKFVLSGREVTVLFERNIKTIDQAIAEIESRYGDSGDRDGWLQAITSYRELMASRGKAAISAIDHANDLEHSHGSMMEHFPPGVRSWYPAFLDFKYTAGIWQMVNKIKDSDLRTIASEIMPHRDRMERLSPKKTDYRTPKGLATEIASQPGKAAKKKMLKDLKNDNPRLYKLVVENLEGRGLYLE